MEIYNIYSDRFIENNIFSNVISNNNSINIQLLYNDQQYNLIIYLDPVKVINERYNINDIQLAKIIQSNDIVDIFENIFTYLPNLYNYCSGCQKKLDYNSDRFITCGDIECSYTMEEIPSNISEIVNIIKTDPNIVNMLLDQAYRSITSERKLQIFEPFPFFMLNQDIKNPIKRGDMSSLTLTKENQEKINKMKDFDKIEKLLNQYKMFIDKCKNYIIDEDIIKDFSLDFYKLVKFILQSNKTRIELESGYTKPIKYSIYKLTHELDIENKYNKSNGNTFLFHGSPSENWYSIIRNGLKITSNSSLMTSGAAYGNGIYFSNDIYLSFSYSKYNKGAYVGVYELFDDLSKYKKTPNIYVIPDSNVVLLRYLIHFENPLDTTQQNKLNSYFGSMVKINKEVISTKINSKGQVKLLHEYKNIISKDPNILGFKVIIENDDLYKWIVKIFKFDDNFPITLDMKKYNIDTINLELSFPQTYPFQPPFIRVLNPRFKYKTGHILSDGGICIELLTPSGWSSVYTIESILIQIKALIIEGDGRIDENKWNIPYTLQEAKQGFERMARSYGWLK